MLTKYRKGFNEFSGILILISLTACKKLTQVDSPVTSVNTGNVFATNATAAAALTGIYTQLSSFPVFTSPGIPSISYFGGLSADEFTLYNGISDVTQIGCYKNALNSQTAVADIWTDAYPRIYETNAAIVGLNNSNSLTPGVKQQLLGEAKFMRAFFYFYLTNFYGNVPLVLSTDYTQTSVIPRNFASQVDSQVIQDLKDAQTLLSGNYVDGSMNTTTERTRPNKWAAAALLSRTYLFTGDYINAESQATSIISNSTLYNLNVLSKVFLKNNQEAIWQLQPVNSGYNTNEGRFFIIPSTGPSNINPVFLSNALLSQFEVGDQRRVAWVDSVIVSNTTYYFPYKYKINTVNQSITTAAGMSEYSMVLRLGEQYLIRAEARAQQGNVNGAIQDLDSIRARAGLGMYTGSQSKDSVVAAIMHERQVELFSEWGHRWLDLKRTGLVNNVMPSACASKGGKWNADWEYYPINLLQLQRNPDLVQNSGY